jgi:hypothetical protein
VHTFFFLHHRCRLLILLPLAVFLQVFLGGETVSEIPLSDGITTEFTFGCMYQMGGLFVTQVADGIMGMGMTGETLVPVLKSRGLIDHQSFAMCFGWSQALGNGGTLSLGGPATHLHTGDTQTAFLNKVMNTLFFSNE